MPSSEKQVSLASSDNERVQPLLSDSIGSHSMSAPEIKQNEYSASKNSSDKSEGLVQMICETEL